MVVHERFTLHRPLMIPSSLAASMHSAVHNFNITNPSNNTMTAVSSNSSDESGQHIVSSFVGGRALLGLWRSKMKPMGQVDSSGTLSWKRIL